MFKTKRGISDEERDCCLNNAKKKYCPDCGRKIGSKRWDAKDFKEWLRGLTSSIIDDVGMLSTECDIDWELGYSAGHLIGKTNDEVIDFDEKADVQICEILGLE